MAKKKQATPLSADAVLALRESSYSENTFALPPRELACYGEIKALMAALGGQWVGKRKRMEFPAGMDCRELVMAACDRGEIPASNPLDFFPTPADVVLELVNHDWLASRWAARLTVADMDERPVRYLEPSGGSGALAAAIVARMRPQDELVIVELNPLLASVLRAKFPQATVVEGDFLEYTPEKPFQVVLMNPPFASKLYQKHVKHAESMLDRFGVLAAIVPSSFLSHGVDFVYHVTERGEWHDLGAGRFEDTETATMAIFLENDPDLLWRDKPKEGYSSHFAWEAAMNIAHDGDLRAKLAECADVAGAFNVLKDWANEQVLSGSCMRVDEKITREVLVSVVSDYEVEELAHLIEKAEDGAHETKPAGEEPVERSVQCELALG